MGSDSTTLQIVLSLIDDASAALAAAQDQFSTFSDGITESMAAASDAMTVSIDGVQYASVEAAQAALDAWTSDSSEAAAAVVEDFDTVSQAAADAALVWVDTWEQSMADLTATMSGGTAAIDADFAGAAEAGTAAGASIESSMSSLGGKFMAVGIQIALVGGALDALAGKAVDDGAKQVEAFDQLGNTVTNAYQSAGTGAAGYTTEVADLQAKIDTASASIDKADASTTKFGMTTAEMAATQASAGATTETATVNIAKYQQQLDQLTQSQQLVGGSASDTITQLENVAKAATQYGFNVDDSSTALQDLFASTSSVTETQQAFQDAMDLSAKTGDSLTQSSNLVIQAMSGMGRGLRDLGVNVADGLSGQTALAAIQQKVAGAAQDAATHGLGPYNVAMAKLNELSADFGTTVLPQLGAFLAIISSIITAVDKWVTEHPKLAAAILEFTAVLGSLMVVLGAFVLAMALTEITVAATEAAFDALGIATALAAPFLLALVVAFVALAAIVVIVIAYHKELFAWLQQTGIITTFQQAWKSISDMFNSQLLPALNTLWTTLQPYVPFFKDFASIVGDELVLALKLFVDGITAWINIATTMLAIGVDVINWFENLQHPIQATITLVQQLITLISQLTTSLSKIGGSAGNAISGFLASAIPHMAAGGIVSSPTIALIGEAGPEAVVPLSGLGSGSFGGTGGGNGNGGGINIYIQGGTYLDQQAATIMSNLIAKNIQRQIKLRSI